MQTIKAYTLESYGIDHAQYFPGVSTTFTQWDHVFLGAGDSPYDAAENAIDDCAVCDYDTSMIKNTLRKRVDSRLLHFEDCPRSKRYGADCIGCDELYFYVALFIKVTTDETWEDTTTTIASD